MTNHRSHLSLLTVLLLGIAACGGDADTSGDTSGDAMSDEGGMQTEPGTDATSMDQERRVEIVQPEEGATVEGPSVTVEFAAHGFQVVEAGDTTANSGHHHFFLDRDISPSGDPIPAEEGYIVHMGDGSSSYTLENVEPGDHTLIAVVGDAYHVPVPGLVDTVQFTVQ